jgi:uncharacterized membrane protein YebE (DUF533 family)
VLVAMVQGAKADGHTGSDETRRRFAHLDRPGRDPEARAIGINERAGPADIGRLTAQASTPAAAAELSAAALPVRVPDTSAERARLDRLAAERRRPPGLLASIERMVAEAG